jgi:hypothetical protein
MTFSKSKPSLFFFFSFFLFFFFFSFSRMGIRRLAALAGLCPVGVELKPNQPAIHVLDFAALVHAAIFGHARTAFSTGTVDSDGVDIGAIDEALDADDLAGNMPFLSFLESTTTASTGSLAATIAATVRRRHAAVARPGIVTIVVLGDLTSAARDIGKNPKIRLSPGGTLRAINRARDAWKTGVTGGRRLDWNAIARFLLGADGLLLRVAEALAVNLGTVCTNGRDSDLASVMSGAVDGIATVWGNTEARAQLEGDTAAARIFVLAQAQGITVLNEYVLLFLRVSVFFFFFFFFFFFHFFFFFLLTASLPQKPPQRTRYRLDRRFQRDDQLVRANPLRHSRRGRETVAAKARSVDADALDVSLAPGLPGQR